MGRPLQSTGKKYCDAVDTSAALPIPMPSGCQCLIRNLQLGLVAKYASRLGSVHCQTSVRHAYAPRSVTTSAKDSLALPYHAWL